jgi:hypothetical protein
LGGRAVADQHRIVSAGPGGPERRVGPWTWQRRSVKVKVAGPTQWKVTGGTVTLKPSRSPGEQGSAEPPIGSTRLPRALVEYTSTAATLEAMQTGRPEAWGTLVDTYPTRVSRWHDDMRSSPEEMECNTTPSGVPAHSGDCRVLETDGSPLLLLPLAMADQDTHRQTKEGPR